jgi:hypothetical protein
MYDWCMNTSGHNFTGSPDAIIADVFKAGMDINCVRFCGDAPELAINSTSL